MMAWFAVIAPFGTRSRSPRVLQCAPQIDSVIPEGESLEGFPVSPEGEDRLEGFLEGRRELSLIWIV